MNTPTAVNAYPDKQYQGRIGGLSEMSMNQKSIQPERAPEIQIELKEMDAIIDGLNVAVNKHINKIDGILTRIDPCPQEANGSRPQLNTQIGDCIYGMRLRLLGILETLNQATDRVAI